LIESQIYAPRCEMSITINIATRLLTLLARIENPCAPAPSWQQWNRAQADRVAV